MEEGYYFYSKRDETEWKTMGVCFVSSGYVHFFGQVSQRLGNEYLRKHVRFGRKINLSEESLPEMIKRIDEELYSLWGNDRFDDLIYRFEQMKVNIL